MDDKTKAEIASTLDLIRAELNSRTEQINKMYYQLGKIEGLLGVKNE